MYSSTERLRVYGLHEIVFSMYFGPCRGPLCVGDLVANQQTNGRHQRSLLLSLVGPCRGPLLRCGHGIQWSRMPRDSLKGPNAYRYHGLRGRIRLALLAQPEAQLEAPANKIHPYLLRLPKQPEALNPKHLSKRQPRSKPTVTS